MKIFKITIDSDFINNESLISALLFECLVSIFLVDESIPNSFEIIKKLTTIINKENFPDLNLILVQKKRETKNSEIKENEINEYLNLYPYIINLKLSLNNKNEVSSISNIINEIKNSKTMLSNIVFETDYQKFDLNYNKSMSFILLGDSLIGKTSFFNRFKNQYYDPHDFTIGRDFLIKRFIIGEDLMKINLWDVSGQERFREISIGNGKKSDGILLLFDVTNEGTFNNLNKWWLKDIKENIKNDQAPLIYLIGNKIDSYNRIISKEVAEKYAKSHGMKYFEISSKYDINIFEVLNLMLLEAYKRNNLDSFIKLMKKFNIIYDFRNSSLLNKYINY